MGEKQDFFTEFEEIPHKLSESKQPISEEIKKDFKQNMLEANLPLLYLVLVGLCFGLLFLLWQTDVIGVILRWG